MVRRVSGHREEALPRSAGGLDVLVLALLLMTTCVLPLFLVAGHSAGLRADLGFDLSVLGLSFFGFFLVSAVASFPAGLVADRLRPAVTARLAVVGSTAVMVALSVLPARTPWFVIVGLLGAAGAFLALAQTCTSGLFARSVRIGRQGLAFGVRQMAIPTATLVAGLTVMMIDGRQWRQAFLWGVGLSTVLLVVLHLFRGQLPDAPARDGPPGQAPEAGRRSALVILAIAASAAGAAGSAIGAFYVEALLDAGHSVQSAGAWLVVGSVIGLLARPAWGWIADRMAAPARLLILLMAFGAMGTGLLVGADAVPFLAVGTLLAFAAGWAWTAIVNFVAVRSSPEAPAAASGIVSTGNFAGGAVGPLVFGGLAAHVSYAAGWVFCAVLFLLGAVLVPVAGLALSRADGPVASPFPRTSLGAAPVAADGPPDGSHQRLEAGVTWSMWNEHLRSGRVGYLNAGGVQTRYLDAGNVDDPLVVFLHGTGGHAEAFIRNLAPVAAAGYRAVAIDLLGHGLTDKPEGCRYDLADYARHLIDVLAALTSAPAHLVGESLGGGVAMRAALLEPERVTTVATVVGGGLGPLEPTEEEQRGWDRMLKLSTRAYDDMDHEAWTARMQWLVHDPATMPDEMVRTRIALYENPQMRRAAAAIYQGVADLLYRRRPGILTAEELERFPVPVFYYWTEHNPTTPPRVAHAAHELTPVSDFEVLEGLGHWPQFEAPAVFNERLLRFLDEFAVRDGVGPVSRSRFR